MYRLLIVDDEPILVDGIYRLMLDFEWYELELFRAYSGDEAVEVLRRNRIDIVLTDIRMPGMSGLELQREINRVWPDCKVIFLSGYNDFDYVQTALRHGSVDYVLKTEPPEEIVASVSRALESLITERSNKQFVARAREQLQLAVPYLRREWLIQLCEGETAFVKVEPQQFEELDIRLRYEEDVLLILGRVDHWKEGWSASDKALLLYAVHNVAEEFLTGCQVQLVEMDRNRFLWLLQPAGRVPEPELEPEEAWAATVRLVQGVLETIQTTCKDLLHMPISLAAGSRPEPWTNVSAAYDRLRKLLSRGLGLSEETLLFEEADAPPEGRVQAERDKHDIRALVKRLTGAEFLFESGDKEEWLRTMEEIAQALRPYYADQPFFIEIYYALASMLLTQVNRWEDEAKDDLLADMDKWIQGGLQANREEAVHGLAALAMRLFDIRKHEQDDRTSQVVDRINRYIHEHLDKDLSLTALSQIVHLNPCYLSRLYKQTTGVGLLDYITDVRMTKAKEYVVESQLKMHEITKQVGFESPAYFARIFKRKTGYTPQEYRLLGQR